MEIKERPILFNGDMVRAILEGRKTQTRRIVKQESVLNCMNENGSFDGPGCWLEESLKLCPFGKVGDRLWVRENAYISPENFTDNHSATHANGRIVGYEASMDAEAVRCARDYGVKCKPSIHMPRWASRITLEIRNVRVERLQDGGDQDFWGEAVWKQNPWVWVIEFERVK